MPRPRCLRQVRNRPQISRVCWAPGTGSEDYETELDKVGFALSTETHSDPTALAQDVRVVVGRIGRRLRDIYAVAQETGGVSFSEVSILSRLIRSGPAVPGRLADAEHVTPQAIGSVLSSLERRGLIEREPDPADGRRVIVTISNSGRRAFEERTDLVTERLAEVLEQALTPPERHRLRAAMSLLERVADEL